MFMQGKFAVCTLLAVSAFTVSVTTHAGYAVPMTAPRPAPLANWYLNGYGGMSILKDLRDGDGDVVDHKLGYDAGGAIGYRAGPIRIEGQYTFIRNSWNNLTDTATGISLKSASIPFSAKTVAQVGMANIYYDFQMPSDTFGIYVGGGAGFAHLKSTISVTVADPTGSVTLMGSGTENKFAYQGTAGVTYNVDNQFFIDLGYRYLGTSKLSNVSTDRFVAHLINLGITYHIPA